MSIFHINRQTSSAMGTGLPFMNNILYQQRYIETETSEKVGYWEVPQNQLPTFQVWNTYDIVSFSMVQVLDGIDQTPIVLDNALLFKNCTLEGKTIFSTQPDFELQFLLPCGFWYFILDFGDGGKIYSEVFFVNGVCCNSLYLGYEVLSVNIDLSMLIRFTVNHTTINSPLPPGYATTVGATTYNTKVFTATLPLNNTSVLMVVDTGNCGVFTQNYTFNNTLGISSSLTPLY